MRLANAALPAAFQEVGGEDLALVDITLDGGRIALVEPASGSVIGARDCGGGIVVPAFVDMHTHLDKGQIWPRTPNPDGTFSAALEATGRDRTAHWCAEDVRRRMDFALRAAYAHGTAAIRTHIDSAPPQDRISWPVFAELREAWAGRIALQGASLSAIDQLPDDLSAHFDHVTAHGGIVGAVMYPVAGREAKLRALLEEAEARGLDVDLHVDEALDPARNDLALVAAEARRIGFSGTITCGHCCTLMTMPRSEADRTLDAVAEAGLAIVSLPMCNLYLQDRQAGRTPRIRGGTLVHEMASRGIPVAIASDNTRDPFYAYGDLDMVEVWREATRILHLDHPVGDWPLAFSATPAAVMGLPDRDRIAPGAVADLVVFEARSWTELLARPQIDRTLIRGGVLVKPPRPDYRELDV
ncbi:cytosine deaminase [Acuticoccus sp. I52.16.1]|uniref:cytosine deaminase n=1 Tax=Acuticoccus sp. I52.16.1 TaxID=2928472 RepID=UPI001FD62E8F|nr:cytosine deaminase [Acuticoccus sp. I52.16.1]UOM35839.1 cytosine deaminase [Acuticoccus sp. I52.16.1]